ncbi:MAG: FCD domain-containing protein [Geminicoccaceae bacterium]
MFEPLAVDRRKLFEQIAAHLERQILKGVLRPGEQFPPERELQERFGVGRPAIREALIALQRAGLVELTNGARARVAMPTASGVVAGIAPAIRQMLSTDAGQRHFQMVRLFFETGLARHAATVASAADVQRLTQALARNEAAIGNAEAFIESDVAFHYVLAEITANPVLIAMHDAMSSWLREQRLVAIENPGQDRIGYSAHREIHAAVARHDPDAAEREMRRHLEQVTTVFWENKAAS